MKPKLTILSTDWPPHVVGGAAVNAALLAQYATEHGWEVTVLTGAPIIPAHSPYQIKSVPDLRPRPSLLYEPWWARRRAHALVDQIPTGTIVHTFDVLSRGIGAALRDLGARQPLVTTIQDISPICGSIDGLLTDGRLCHGDSWANLLAHQKLHSYGILGRLTRALRYAAATVRPYRRTLLAQYTAVTTVSNFLKAYLDLPGASVIPDLLVPPTQACKLERTTAPSLLAVGRLGYDKGTDLLIRVLARLPAFLLTLVGGGDQGPYRSLAEQLGVLSRITFVGQVPIWDVGNWYHAADLVVSGSRCAEGSSRTLLEAMSCGRAVVGPDFGGVAEVVIEGSTGRLYQRGDLVSLALAVERAYRERRSLGKRGQQAARQYRPEVVGPQYLTLYKSLL